MHKFFSSLVVFVLLLGGSTDFGHAEGIGGDSDQASFLQLDKDHSALPPLLFGTTQAPSLDQQRCCKICTVGQACGNSCISRQYQCHQPPGCACDG